MAVINFDSFRQKDGIPVYLQIIRYIKQGLASGTICAGDELPSRRLVSAMLSLNPNTVQKAFSLLEEEGLILSKAGAKSCVVADEDSVKRIRRELIGDEIGRAVCAMKAMGLSLEQAKKVLEQYYGEEN